MSDSFCTRSAHAPQFFFSLSPYFRSDLLGNMRCGHAMLHSRQANPRGLKRNSAGTHQTQSGNAFWSCQQACSTRRIQAGWRQLVRTESSHSSLIMLAITTTISGGDYPRLWARGLSTTISDPLAIHLLSLQKPLMQKEK